MHRKYLPVRPSKGKAFMIIGMILCIYILDNLPDSIVIDYMLYSNFVKPVLWLGLAGLVWALPRVRSRAPLKLNGNIYLWAFNFAVIFIIISVIAGLIDGFGKSPYEHSLKGVLLNILIVGSMLLGREAARSYIVNNITEKENFLVFIPIAIYMTIISFSVNKFIELEGMEKIVRFIAQYLIPDFLQNLMATYLAFLGGWLPALIYMGIMQAFHWLSPILPDLKWITAALIGIMCPAFSLAAMQGIYLKDTKAIKKTEKDKDGLAGWLVTSLVSIGIIWFSVGVFPVYPSVIATGSMEPMIKPGDIIIVKKIHDMNDIDQLKPGDVIQFKRGSILISHRIIEVMVRDDEKSYRTKGDNNRGADTQFVKPEDIKGTIEYVIPKLGWPTLLIKQEENVPLEEVTF